MPKTVARGQGMAWLRKRAYLRGVANAPEIVTLVALSLSPNTASVGSPYSGTVTGKTTGSTLSLTGAGAAGLSVVGSAVTGTPTTEGAVNIVETLAGATNTPRTSSGVLTVASAGATYPDTPGSYSRRTTSSTRLTANPTKLVSFTIPAGSSVTAIQLIDGNLTSGNRVVGTVSGLTAGQTRTFADLTALGLYGFAVNGLRFVQTGTGAIDWVLQ